MEDADRLLYHFDPLDRLTDPPHDEAAVEALSLLFAHRLVAVLVGG